MSTDNALAFVGKIKTAYKAAQKAEVDALKYAIECGEQELFQGAPIAFLQQFGQCFQSNLLRRAGATIGQSNLNDERISAVHRRRPRGSAEKFSR